MAFLNWRYQALALIDLLRSICLFGKLLCNRLLSELATNRPGANFLFADRQDRMRRVATRPGIDITELLVAEAGAKDKFKQVGLVFGRYVNIAISSSGS